MPDMPGACDGGTWFAADCGETSLSCCLPPAPTPSAPCELHEGGTCILPSDRCSGRLESSPTYACQEGSNCCLAPIGVGLGGAGGGVVLPPGGYGGG
jgi:hypothetical protein